MIVAVSNFLCGTVFMLMPDSILAEYTSLLLYHAGHSQVMHCSVHVGKKTLAFAACCCLLHWCTSFTLSIRSPNTSRRSVQCICRYANAVSLSLIDDVVHM